MKPRTFPFIASVLTIVCSMAALPFLHPDAGRIRAESAKPNKKVYVCPPCGHDCDKHTFDKPGVCPHCGMTLIAKTDVKPANPKPVSVVILMFDGVEIIDYSGPWEIFGAAGFDVHTVAVRSGPIKTAFGQKVIPDYTLENCPRADILLLPGGDIDRTAHDAQVMQWIRNHSRDSRHVISVCNGAFFLAHAGLLDGLSSTTIRHSLDRLATIAPKTKVVRDRRYVDNGKVITTAGLSAGMDGALHLVAKIEGKETAQSIASGLEYKWNPESD
jgi:transcriptional regulator GlxA family with amidase domain/predicted RNA-binding Zn-ribbon protein involved in translation (DUF1610 family)